ncbi:MAG: hypothetical protein HC803_04515 [Saprospiraceae bacterium]|nr:hypothetical protein [Saprospiraceae bacterium]
MVSHFYKRRKQSTCFWVTTQPLQGEGITILGPYADLNTPTLIDAKGQEIPLKEGKIPAPTKSTNLIDLSTQSAILVYSNDNKIQMITLSETTNWKALLQYFQSEKGKKAKCQIVWMKPTRSNSFSINDKVVTLDSKTADSKYGDILIDDVPIDPF